MHSKKEQMCNLCREDVFCECVLHWSVLLLLHSLHNDFLGWDAFFEDNEDKSRRNEVKKGSKTDKEKTKNGSNEMTIFLGLEERKEYSYSSLVCRVFIMSSSWSFL